jgi:RNA polymerase sigma-70 factor (ECF subfamily)
MFRILHNTFLNSRTGLQATASVPLDEDADSPNTPAAMETPESLLLRRSDWQLVHDAIEQLPLPYREVLLLCDLEEFSYKDISAALSIPIGTVMSRLARARKALRIAVQKIQKGASYGV